MTDLSLIIIIIGLFIVIVAQVIERHYATSDDTHIQERTNFLNEIAKLNSALITKNTNEYLAVRAMDKAVAQIQPREESDEQDVSTLNDEEYQALIDRQNGK
jgi:hypothetical protein